jgi:hypothetical protein
VRLTEDANRKADWRRWGPYLAERQWGTVREDYSHDGDAWRYFTHDHARMRAYRWGEDGLLGFCDRRSRLCFALALWNHEDPILKERLFGLTNPEGNHGEDAKECWYYLDSTPTHSYARGLYKYPQKRFPYEKLLEANVQRSKLEGEYELHDTGIFDDHRYFDVFVEYAKASPEDILIRLSIHNRGPEAANLDVLPQLWFRNTWAWGSCHGAVVERPELLKSSPFKTIARHPELGEFTLRTESDVAWYFTENETNLEALYEVPNAVAHVKDAFHQTVVDRLTDKVHPSCGTKCAAHFQLRIEAAQSRILRLRLSRKEQDPGTSTNWWICAKGRRTPFMRA